jgi:SAM-dependent methyltransferase
VTTTVSDVAIRLERSGYARPGFAERYDAYRPQPPPVLVEILTQLAQTELPRLVVDLGSGTGLSTRLWAGRAEAVIGVEPNAAMRRQAEARTAALGLAGTVNYRDGVGHATGLPTGTADIVTCAQSLHWMEPVGTLAEIARLLRPGGVFAAYDYHLPPAVHWEAERAFADCHERGRCAVAGAVGAAHADGTSGSWWPKEEHLTRMEASGHFRYVRELVVHSREEGDAERLLGFALSAGYMERALADGSSPDELGITTLRAVAERTIGSRPVPWYIGYRVCVGVK